jgi:hypothetical protein
LESPNGGRGLRRTRAGGRPSGACTGTREVLELRDGGAAFGDKGVTQGGVGDEGGFAPELEANEAPLDLLVSAIEADGDRPGDDVAICLDSAGSEFLHDGRDELPCEGRSLSSAQMIELWPDIAGRRPLRFFEDGLAESDWDGWKQLTDRLGDRLPLVGDDMFVTDPGILREGIERGIAYQPDRDADRDARHDCTGPLRRLPVCDLAPLGRHRGPVHRRPRRRDGRGIDQDGRPGALRAGREVQPAAAD